MLFDGQCGLCSGAVRSIWRRDRRGYFRFAALQSEAGAKLLARYGVARDLDTVVLIENGRAFTRSTAALRIARRLGWPWRLLAGFFVVPRLLRDAAYAAIARRRHRWFGRRERCEMPSEQLRERWIDEVGESRRE